MKLNRLACIVLAAGLAGVGGGEGRAATTTILFNEFAPPPHILNKGVVGPWMKEVERVTHGRVKFQVPANNLAPPPRQMDIVETGIADGAYMFNGFLVKKAPLVQVSLLPGVTRSSRGSAVALWRTYQKFFAKAGEFKGVTLLGFLAVAPGEIYSLTSPIRAVADFKGRKTWSLPGYTAKSIAALGAVVVPGPAVHMYEIISKGTVDAYAGVSVSSAKQFNVLKYAKSITLLPDKVQGPTFSMFLSKKKWASLSAADRKAIRSVSGEALARLCQSGDALEAKAREGLGKSGKEVIKASPAFVDAVEKAWAPIQASWVASADKLGVDGKAALAYFKKVATEQAGHPLH